MKILLIGKKGQVGWELHRTLLPLGEVVAVDYPEIDLTDVNQTRQLVRSIQPQLIVNAAAYTNVDQAETEKEIAFAINGVAPGVLAEEAKKIGSIFVHYSTDYVFDGQKGKAYLEEDQPNPINFYGESKLAGELAVQEVNGMHLILRTSWVYSLRRPCFVTKVLQWAREKKTLRIVEDQIANPTWCRTLAEITSQILGKENRTLVDWLDQKKGIYHVAGKGSTTRYEWVKIILEEDPQCNQHKVERILPAKTSEFHTPAARPAFSALNCDKVEEVFKIRIPPWEEQLSLALDRGEKNDF